MLAVATCTHLDNLPSAHRVNVTEPNLLLLIAAFLTKSGVNKYDSITSHYEARWFATCPPPSLRWLAISGIPSRPRGRGRPPARDFQVFIESFHLQ
jgi:hypothetical protein